MRFYRGSVCRMALTAAFLTLLIIIPVFSYAGDPSDLKTERKMMKIDAQFGEPGHDPFSRWMEPGGETYRNREGEPYQTYSLPGSGGGGGGNGGGNNSSAQNALLTAREMLIRIINSLI